MQNMTEVHVLKFNPRDFSMCSRGAVILTVLDKEEIQIISILLLTVGETFAISYAHQNSHRPL